MSFQDRKYQSIALDEIELAFGEHDRVVAVAPTGAGKCLGRGTPVLLADGRIVPVESVKKGDVLQGPDGPRHVLSTCRGWGPLYKVTPIKGDAWICNDAHILTVIRTETGEILDISVIDWLAQTKWFRHLHKQFCVGVEYSPAAALPIDPYFLGVWIGDGSKSIGIHGLASVQVSKPDPEIAQLMMDTAHAWGLYATEYKQEGKCPTWRITRRHEQRDNELLSALRDLLGPDLRIPLSYLTASRADRLMLLAGWIDSDGYLSKGFYEVAQKNENHADGLVQLARSLGFRVTRIVKYVHGTPYQRISILGDVSQIPVRIARKKSEPRKQIKDATRTGITVEPVGDGEYFGFQIDGDGRFLLGDFTVTHNTVIAATAIKRAVERGESCLFLCHRKELKDQISRTMSAMALVHGNPPALPRPEASIQVSSIQAMQAKRSCFSCRGKPELSVTCPLCQGVGKIKSRKLPRATLIVVDEAHRVMGDGYMALLKQYPGAKVLAITATPWRLDGQGLGSLFTKMIVVANMQELIDQKFLLRPRLFGPPKDIDLKGIKIQNREYHAEQLGDRMKQETLVGNIVDHYQELANNERAIVFAVNVAHSQEIAKRFVERGIACEHLDGTTPKIQRESILKRLETGETRVVSNVDVLVEGFDLPSLHCAILARPTKSITRYLQQVGRPMRPFGDQTYALILDHANCVKEHGLPQEFRDWSLEDRTPESRLKGPRVESEFKNCPKCEQLMRVNGACSHCNPQLFADMFIETDHKLVEYRHEEQIEIDLPKPVIETKAKETKKRRLNAPCMKCAGTKVRQKIFDGYKLKRTCPDCREVEWTVDDDAVARATAEQRLAEWRRLEAVRVEKGFKSGWTAHQYKNTFGSWPPSEFSTSPRD